jgi:hypothetical protein
MSTPFSQTIIKNAVPAAIVLIVTALVPSILWLHNAYADDRYLLKEDSLRLQINQIDNKLFEISQEIIFAETEAEADKAQSMEGYYEREKEALQELLDEM